MKNPTLELKLPIFQNMELKATQKKMIDAIKIIISRLVLVFFGAFAGLTILLLFISFIVPTQNLSDFIFQTYSVKVGFSQSSAMVTFKDRLDYRWMRTESSIHRFDVYEC